MDNPNYTTEHRKGQHLLNEERYDIQVRLKDGWSIYRIAKHLGRAYNTIKDEIERGTVTLYNGKVKRYKADQGKSVYLENREHSTRRYRVFETAPFLEYVVKQFKNEHWSLDAIFGYALHNELFKREEMVCTKTLYNYVSLGLLPIKNIDLPEKCFAYTAQTGCDKNGYVMDVTVNPGNMHDSVAFDGLYDRLAEKNPEIKAVVADAGYKTPWISKRILDDGRIPVLPYKRPMSKKGFFPPYEYVYDEYFNCVICPENQVLSYATTNREGYREFKSKGYICENCPSRHLCTENQKFEKTVTKHIWSDYLETVEDIRHTPEYKALYERRKETIERVFADAKEKYAMRYTPYRGLSQVTNWVRLKFAAMNLKKYALHRWKRSHQYSALIRLYTFFAKTKLITLNLA